jgi:hypothetical protein
MKRRRFVLSLASFPALLSQPAAFEAEENRPPELPAVSDEIKALEEYVRKHPAPFPWAEHNELRHLYGAISEAKSMKHADIILANSLMDDYILNTLSDWQLDQDPGRAVVSLLTRAEQHPSRLHTRAACLMRAGEVCARTR